MENEGSIDRCSLDLVRGQCGCSLSDGFQWSRLQLSEPCVISLIPTGKAVSGTAEMVECDFRSWVTEDMVTSILLSF